MCNVKAWMIEETDYRGNIVWKMISFFEPDSLEWMRDLKGKKHNLTITELVAGNVKKIEGIKKYDSKRLVDSNSGL
jgi:hypothetical protein